jgi:hypothetical protein
MAELPKVEELTASTPGSTPAPASLAKYRNTFSNNDTLEKIQEDFRRAVIELESRCKLMLDELKRVVG